MAKYLWIVLTLGLTALIIFLFRALQRWTAGKQQQMNAEEFRLWFQKNYMGVGQENLYEVHSGARPLTKRTPGLTKTLTAMLP